MAVDPVAYALPALIETGAAGPVFFLDESADELFAGTPGTTYDLYAQLLNSGMDVVGTVSSDDGGPLAQIEGGTTDVITVDMSSSDFALD